MLQKEFHPILQRVVTLRPSTSTTELRPATKVLHVYSCLFNDQVCSKATLQGNGKVFSSRAYKLNMYSVYFDYRVYFIPTHLRRHFKSLIIRLVRGLKESKRCLESIDF